MYCFWDRWRFPSKIAKFPTSFIFCTPAEGVQNWVLTQGVKKLEWWGYQAEKEVWRYFQPSGYYPPTWRTNGQTPGHSKDLTQLCIALCHKNCSTFAKAIVFILDFIGAKGDAGGSNNWSFKTCKAPMKSLSNQQCQSTEGTKHHTPWTWSPQAHLGVLHPCHYHY